MLPEYNTLLILLIGNTHPGLNFWASFFSKKGGEGVIIIMYGRSRMTIDPRIPTMLGGGTQTTKWRLWLLINLVVKTFQDIDASLGVCTLPIAAEKIGY